MADGDASLDEFRRLAERMRELAAERALPVDEEITNLESKLQRAKAERAKSITAWKRVQIARNPKRPYTLDLLALVAKDFLELHGDRAFADDPAIVGGLAEIAGRSVVVVGHQKGHDTKENLMRNFGMPNPEGIRKGLRLMKLAEKFALPIVTFLDTAGAFPGLATEERGGAEAIGRNIREMASLAVPIVVCVIGEGGSGGALALGVGDRILMLENAYYSVISPEGAAAILLRDGSKASEVAEAMKLTSRDLVELGIVDEVVPEPPGGAHEDHAATANALRAAIVRALDSLCALSPDELVERRYQKYRRIGVTAGA